MKTSNERNDNNNNNTTNIEYICKCNNKYVENRNGASQGTRTIAQRTKIRTTNNETGREMSKYKSNNKNNNSIENEATKTIICFKRRYRYDPFLPVWDNIGTNGKKRLQNETEKKTRQEIDNNNNNNEEKENAISEMVEIFITIVLFLELNEIIKLRIKKDFSKQLYFECKCTNFNVSFEYCNLSIKNVIEETICSNLTHLAIWYLQLINRCFKMDLTGINANGNGKHLFSFKKKMISKN